VARSRPGSSAPAGWVTQPGRQADEVFPGAGHLLLREAGAVPAAKPLGDWWLVTVEKICACQSLFAW